MGFDAGRRGDLVAQVSSGVLVQGRWLMFNTYWVSGRLLSCWHFYTPGPCGVRRTLPGLRWYFRHVSPSCSHDCSHDLGEQGPRGPSGSLMCPGSQRPRDQNDCAHPSYLPRDSFEAWTLEPPPLPGCRSVQEHWLPCPQGADTGGHGHHCEAGPVVLGQGRAPRGRR